AAHMLSPRTLYIVFGTVLTVIAAVMFSRLDRRNVILDPTADPGWYGGRFYDEESAREVVYRVRRMPLALVGSFLAGNISSLLGIGAIFSTVMFAAGVGLWLIVDGRPFVDRLLNAGIIVLIVTPVTRVVASTVIYIVQRDWHMVLMTGLVLLSLALSVVVAMQ